MLESLSFLVRNTLLGTVIFVTIVAGGTYYLQSSLVLVKHYNSYTHWEVILFVLPVMAGITQRISKIRFPFISIFGGTLISTLILYPQYKKLWAVPPTSTDTIIYTIIIFGIGFIAAQPLKTTFMIAFRLGRYSIQKISKQTKPTTGSSKSGKKSPPNNVHSRSLNSAHTLAIVELAIGASSLALSVFSVFFMGKG